ncbi:hypothetical protein KQI52_14995 [bacterium]|nr:hypothetical protein [bacterium]
MKKLALTLFAVLFAISGLAVTAVQATEPPAYGVWGAGWGNNPNNWDRATGSYNSGLSLYNDDLGDYVHNFDPTDGSYDVISYAPINIELWIELHMIETYAHTHYEFHRIGNADETVEFIIEGTVKSNQTNWVGLTAGADGFEFLQFRHGMYGGGADIPLTWMGRYGDGLTPGAGNPAWTTFVDPDDNGIGFTIAKCDHWFQFKGQFELPYHIDDGYYSLEIAGCPVPEL